MDFAARLRELSEKASPGPWGIACYCPHQPMTGALNSYVASIARGKGVTVDQANLFAPGKIADHLDRTQDRPPGSPGPTPNAALIVSLRNAADRIADLVAAGVALVNRYDEVSPRKGVVDVGQLVVEVEALDAALRALNEEPAK